MDVAPGLRRFRGRHVRSQWGQARGLAAGTTWQGRGSGTPEAGTATEAALVIEAETGTATLCRTPTTGRPAPITTGLIMIRRFTRCEAHRRTTVDATRGTMSTFERLLQCCPDKQQASKENPKKVPESDLRSDNILETKTLKMWFLSCVILLHYCLHFTADQPPIHQPCLPLGQIMFPAKNLPVSLSIDAPVCCRANISKNICNWRNFCDKINAQNKISSDFNTVGTFSKYVWHIHNVETLLKSCLEFLPCM